MKKLLLIGSALALAPFAANAQRPPSFLQGQPLSFSMLNKAFQNTIALNGLSMVGACQGNSSPNGPNQATITVTCPGAGQPGGANGSIQVNSGGLFSGVTMSGDATMDLNGVLTLNTVPVSKGGTGANNPASARASLGISTVGSTGAYSDLTGLPTLGTMASQAMPAAGLVNSTGSALVPVPSISGDATLNLTTGVLTLGTVGVPKGGTGATAFTAHQLLIGQGQLGLTTTTGGTSGQVLTSQGPNSDPIWAAPTGGGGSGLTAIANNTLLGNTSGGSAIPVATTVTAMLDAGIGNTRGAVLSRGATGWQPITPGSAGNCLTSNGANTDPTWQTCGGGTPFGGTGGVVGVDANGTPFIFTLNGLTISPGTGSGILTAGGGGGGGTGGGTETVNQQSGTTYSVSSSDATTLLSFGNTSPVAVSLPQAGSTIVNGWFADFQNTGTGAVTITPSGTSTIDGGASITLYQNQGIRIASDGSDYFTQRGTFGGQTIDTLPTAGAVSDADIFPVVQSGSNASQQTFSNLWSWVNGHLSSYQPPQIVLTANATLDNAAHNGKLLTVTSPITISLPSALPNLGVGFQAVIFNQSGGTVTLSNNGASWGSWQTSSGSLSIPAGQMAFITVIQPSTTGVVYASISNTGSGGGGGGTTGAPPVSGRYYGPIVSSTIGGSPTAGRLYALPVKLSAGTYRGLAFWAPTASVGSPTTCRMALYSDNNGVPGSVLAENIITTTVGVTGTYYADFTGGDYTTATDIHAWSTLICSTINQMGTTMVQPTANVQPYMHDSGGTNPIGGAQDAVIYSGTITSYPASALGSTNSGNFGTITYNSTPNGTPIVSVRAR